MQTLKLKFDGTHRSAPEHLTLAQLEPALKRFGITRVANVTGLDDIGIPTVVVTRPNSRSLSVSQGKGLSLAAAKVSGLMESIEQYHAENANPPLRLASYREQCRRAKPIDVTRLPRSVRAFDADARILWTTATRRSDGERVEVPFELVHLNLTSPLPPGSGFFPLGSNGLASGNCLLEAITHGAWELIERDAVSLFYRLPVLQQAERRVALDSVNDAACRELLSRFEAAGVGVMIWDITTDLGIAAFFCSIIERELNPFRRIGIARGYGCHLDRAVALCRALTEAAQSRLTRISGSRDDLPSDDVERIRAAHAILRHQTQLDAFPERPRRFDEVPSQRLSSFEADLDWTERRLAQQGLGPIVYVDLSSTELPLAFVRVIIPGLEGMAEAPGYVPGPRARAAEQGSLANGVTP